MRVVPLSNAPNQSFTVTIDNVRWVLRLITVAGCMAVDVDRDGVTLLRAVRALAGEPFIPYRYLQTGNFIFVTINDEIPQADLFGQSQTLVFLTAAEIAAVPQITIGEIIAASRSVEYLFDDQGFYLTTDTGELIESA